MFKINQNSVADGYINFYIVIQGYDDDNNKTGNQIIYNNAIANEKYVFDFSTLTTYAFYKNSTQFSFCILSRKNAINDFKIYDIAYYSDTDTTEYEAYVEPVTTNIYLDEPLRKVGDYADYIDFENQKVVRKIYKSKPYGEASLGSAYNSGLCRYQFQPKPLPNFDIAPVSNALIGNSGQIIIKANNTTLNSTYKNIYTYFSCADVGIDVPDTTTSNTTYGTAIKKYIDEKGIYIHYVLETPTEETIDLPIIPTNEGTNIIEIDTSISPSNMEVDYYAKGVE